LRQTSEIFADWVGPEHAWTAYPLTALGRTLLAEGRSREAVAILQRALRIRESSEPNAELVAETRFALARALWFFADERRTAEKLAIAARESYRKLPKHEKQVGDIDVWLRAPGT
jgi:tetratricopeptide (TPR) repeat protein